MTRVLQILSSLKEGGGVQTMLRNYYSHMDLSGLQTDFVVCGSQIGGMEAWFEALGSRIRHIPPRGQNPVGNLSGLRNILRTGHYDVVHCHQDYHGAAASAMAEHYGVKKRIIHSHQAYPPENWLQRTRRRISVPGLLRSATDFAACGRMAGEWLYGSEMMESGRVQILHNAVSPGRYAFSGESRERLRRELGIDRDTGVLGHVGRFSRQKNHALTVRIFAEFSRHHRDCVLLLAGDGELRQDTEKQVRELGLEEKVRFLGIRQDVPELLSAMDLFLLPSRWEGLCFVMIEAQMNGLPAVCSSYVSRDVKLADNVFFTADHAYDDPAAWSCLMEKALSAGRGDYREAVAAAGYDICREAKKLEELYRGV